MINDNPGQELSDALTTAYIAYAKETIQDRALPDVRDGLKPVQRRIVYAMHAVGLTHNRPPKKSARIVGEVLGKYHPHGDQSVYLAMVRQAQKWVMRVPLVDGQGNFGSIDGDSPAAMRYTEARLTSAADALLQDLKMDTVDWQANFDDSLKEPKYLPAALPNLLVNGVTGIAVGMSTCMPPHNLGEVCDAVVHVARNWKRKKTITVDEMLAIIPGPDFPTGGILFQYRDDDDGPVDMIKQAYETGRARLIMQSRMTQESRAGGRTNLIISELPYGVLKTTVIERIAKEIRDGRIKGITDLRDESDYSGMRVVIEVSRQASVDEVLEQVLKYSQARETFGVINLALVPTSDNGNTAPMYLTLVELLIQFVSHRLNVITRRSRFELEQKKARLHIVEGLLRALDVLDEVIDTIRRSRTPDSARTNLKKKFKFSDPQTTAILDMQLRRLAALERKRLKDEEKELKKRMRYLNSLLKSQAKRLDVVVKETTSLKQQFATPRLTQIISQASNGPTLSLAEVSEAQIIVLHPDRIMMHAKSNFAYRAKNALSARRVTQHLAHTTVEPHESVLLISSGGQIWSSGLGSMSDESSWPQLGLPERERVVAALATRKDQYIIMVTRAGRIKRVDVESLMLVDHEWSPIFGLKEDDQILYAGVGPEQTQVVIFTEQGQLLRFESSSVTPQATPSAKGVAGPRLRSGDTVRGATLVTQPDNSKLRVLVMSSKGWGHAIRWSSLPIKGRTTQGIRGLKTTPATGTIGSVVIAASGMVEVYLSSGQRQRLQVREFPVTAQRDARGKRLVRLPQNTKVDMMVQL